MENQNMTSEEKIGAGELLSMNEVMAITTYSRPSIYRLIAAGSFPSPVKLGASKIAFHKREINEWLGSRPAAIEPKIVAAGERE